MQKLVVIISLIGLLTSIVVGNYDYYDCAKIRDLVALPEIDYSKYLGEWYELYHSNGFYFDKDCMCTNANYSVNKDQSIRVVNSCIKYGKEITSVGKANYEINNSYGALDVSFYHGLKAPYYIFYLSKESIYNEYEYAGVMSCSNIPFFGGINIWILGRDSEHVDNNEIKKILYNLIELGFKDNIKNLIMTNHSHKICDNNN